MIEGFRKAGRKTFLLTNSLWEYTQVVMNYLEGNKTGRYHYISNDIILSLTYNQLYIHPYIIYKHISPYGLCECMLKTKMFIRWKKALEETPADRPNERPVPPYLFLIGV